jgi:hypothetical protein
MVRLVSIRIDGGDPLILGAAEARELALDLQAAAEKIDPRPPPRADRGPKRKGR